MNNFLLSVVLNSMALLICTKKPSRSWEKEVGKSFERKIPLPDIFYHKSGGIID
jgi:hypothetical protein